MLFPSHDRGGDPKVLLSEHCKKWCYQLEVGEQTGKKHFQGRFSLKVKLRFGACCKKFPGWHLSITSNENRDNDFYVTKEDTRVAGPWKDTDEVIFIPDDLKVIKELRPWQEDIIRIAETQDFRTVNVVYDPVGNSGKTTVMRWCMVHKIGRKLPFVNDFKDLMRMAMDMPVAKCYMFDLPRAINKEKLFQLYAGIEELKSGYCFDDRYHFKERIFNPPVVIVFTNKLPDENLLSRDRWKIWTITVDGLREYIDDAEFINGNLGVAL
jgi:hypothetical protein